MSNRQFTVALIKPDAMRRSLVGQIITRIERTPGLSIVDMRWLRMRKSEAEEFYMEHEGRAYYDRLVEFITSGPIVALVLKGQDAVGTWRKMMGPADPAKRVMPEIRAVHRLPGDVPLDVATMENLVHGSDSEPSAMRELAILDDIADLRVS